MHGQPLKRFLKYAAHLKAQQYLRAQDEHAGLIEGDLQFLCGIHLT